MRGNAWLIRLTIIGLVSGLFMLLIVLFIVPIPVTASRPSIPQNSEFTNNDVYLPLTYSKYNQGDPTPTPIPTPAPPPLFETLLYMPDEKGSATIPDNPSLDLGEGDGDDFTIEMFFHISDLSYDPTYVNVLARKNKSYSFYIQFNNPDPDKIFFTIELLGVGEILLWVEMDIQQGWHHVAAVFDNEYTVSEDAFSIYLDGDRVAHSPDENIHVDWTPGIPPSTRDLEIGGVGGGSAGFHGYIEEARVSNIARYTNPTYSVPTNPFVPDGNTRALWHFNETPGSTVFMDESTNGNHLTGHDGAQTHTP